MSTKIQGQAPRPAQPQNPEIVCPVIRGIVNEGHLPVDAKGNAKISDLKEVFEDLGLSRNAAYVATLGNRPSQILSNLWNGKFNVNQLRGGMLDHSGDSMILRKGEFDPQKFAALIAHSKDGKTMSMDDFKRAVKANKEIDQASWAGSKISEIEFSILTNAFGTKGADGQKRISIEDLRGLYEDKKIPGERLSSGEVQAQNPASVMSSLARNLPTGSPSGMAKAGVQSALGQNEIFTPAGLAAKSAGQGLCPHVQSGGAKTTSDTNNQLKQLHNEIPIATQQAQQENEKKMRDLAAQRS